MESKQYSSLIRNEQYNQPFIKAERIVAAIYLVTGYLSDSDPFKWDIRGKAIAMMRYASSVNGATQTEVDIRLENLLQTIREIVALLDVGLLSGFVSPMNHSILKRELDAFHVYYSMIKQKESYAPPPLFEKRFFGRPLPKTVSQGAAQEDQREGFAVPKKEAVKDTYRTTDEATKEIEKDNTISQVTIRQSAGNRRDIILQLLSRMDVLSIKDFMNVIQGCSEKTVQRELSVMVHEGILKRHGKRRWSKYSLAFGGVSSVREINS